MSPGGRCRCGCLVEHHDVPTPSPELLTCRGCDELCIMRAKAAIPRWAQPGERAWSTMERWTDRQWERLRRFPGYGLYPGASREHTD